MPDSGVKISSLPSAAAEDIQGTDVLAGVSDDATKKFTFTNILTWIKARLSKSDVGLDNVANVLQYSASNPPPTPTKSDIGLGNVDNVQQYSASNPPPYPVTSVNGQIGAVSITIPTPASPSDASPAMDGTAAAGSSPDFARGDHVHPTDTSRQATINVSGVLAGDGNGGVAAVTVDSSPDTSHTSNLISSAAVAGALTALESDLAAIHATGTTNTTGAMIAKGMYFYLNGSLVQAKENIASGATFTNGTNYVVVTAGGLNSLKAALDPIQAELSAFTAYGHAYGGGDSVNITLPQRAPFSEYAPLFVVCIYRGQETSDKNGIAVLKCVNNIPLIAYKANATALTGVAYDTATRVLTLSCVPYTTFLVIGRLGAV